MVKRVKIKSVKMPKRGILVKDDSGHDYFIPQDKALEFEAWVENTERDGFDNEIDFDECRLEMSPNWYVFDMIEERRA